MFAVEKKLQVCRRNLAFNGDLERRVLKHSLLLTFTPKYDKDMKKPVTERSTCAEFLGNAKRRIRAATDLREFRFQSQVSQSQLLLTLSCLAGQPAIGERDNQR